MHRILVEYDKQLSEARPAIELEPADFNTLMHVIRLHPRADAKIGVGVQAIFVAKAVEVPAPLCLGATRGLDGPYATPRLPVCTVISDVNFFGAVYFSGSKNHIFPNSWYN